MKKGMDDIKQFKSLDDLREIVSELEGIMARPVKRGAHATLYPDVKDGEYRTVCGVRVVDYILSNDEKWVLPHNQKGLSFSGNWKEIKRVYRMFSRGKNKQVDVHWVIEGADLPPGMAFIEDQNPKKKGHYFLTVTERMPLYKLVSNLKWVADRMSIIENVGELL